MSSGLVWVCVGLGLATCVVRRRSAVVGLVALQSLLIGLAALGLGAGGHAAAPIAGIALVAKAVVVAVLLGVAVRRTPHARPLGDDAAPAVRAAAAIVLALALAWLVPTGSLAEPAAVRGGLALLACGMVVALTRRATLFQLLGLLVVENGVAVAALGATEGLPVAVELGVALDLVVLVAVAVAFQSRILEAFGTTDDAALTRLRD